VTELKKKKERRRGGEEKVKEKDVEIQHGIIPFLSSSPKPFILFL
jgi:hypothetical protein